MSSLTRWVLLHKRTVVITWIVLTFAGIAAAGPATDALDSEFSVPGKESWETNVAIAEQYGGDRNGTAPLLPVVTLPKGETVHSPGVRSELAALDARLDRRFPARASPRTRRPATARSCRTTGGRCSRSSIRVQIRTRPSARTPRLRRPRARL